MIEQLRKIGLSELEARCYLVLHEDAGLSGYEVARRVSVSRTNVYAALRSLMDKGACRMIEGDPGRYDAVPIDQLLRHVRREFEQNAQELISELKMPPRSDAAFYSWRGGPALDKAIHRLIANAQKTIVVDAWSEDIYLFEEALLSAQERGITVVLIVLGPYRTALRNVYIHKRSTILEQDIGRKFSLLCDYRSALLGSFGGVTKQSALETDHPAVIEVLKNAFYHDLLMQHIEADFGPLLTEKYGEQYQKLLDFYLKEKGWDLK